MYSSGLSMSCVGLRIRCFVSNDRRIWSIICISNSRTSSSSVAMLLPTHETRKSNRVLLPDANGALRLTKRMHAEAHRGLHRCSHTGRDEEWNYAEEENSVGKHLVVSGLCASLLAGWSNVCWVMYIYIYIYICGLGCEMMYTIAMKLRGVAIAVAGWGQ